MAEENQAGQGDKRPPIIVRGRITNIQAEKKKDAPISGMELFVEPTDVKANNKFLEIWFKYRVVYKEDVGFIALKGVLLFELTELNAKKIANDYKDKGFFEEPWSEIIANNVNFKCSTEAVLPAKMLDLPAPIMPPRVKMSNQPNQQPIAQVHENDGEATAAPQSAPAPSAGQPAAGRGAPEGGPDGAEKKPGAGKSQFPFPSSQPPPFTKQ